MASVQLQQPESQGTRRKANPAVWLVHGIVILLCMLTIFPFIWMLSTSLKIPTPAFTKDIRIIPRSPTLRNFPDVFDYFPVTC